MGSATASRRAEWVLVYLGWTLCACSCSLGLVSQGIWPGDPTRATRTSTAAILGTLGLMVLIARWSNQHQRRGVMFSITALVAGVTTGLIFTAGVWSEPPSRLQSNLQGVLARRSQTDARDFRGVRVVLRSNSQGWPGAEPRTGARNRFVFIGDSFLEVRSSRNLAERVEERLKAGGMDADVMNLAKADSDPSSEYRHRFFELALPPKPRRILMFVYAGNDLSTRYRHQPYRHPTFFVTSRAVAFAKEVSSRFVEPLQRLADAHTPLHSQRELLDALPAHDHAQLVYLAVLTYSHSPAGLAGLGSRIPRFVERGREGAVNVALSLRGLWRRDRPGCAATAWPILWDAYQDTVFTTPPDARLEAMGAFIGQRYCRQSNVAPFVRALRAQDAQFRTFVTAEADMPYYLFPAVAFAATGSSTQDTAVSDTQINVAAAEYGKLFAEMSAAARSQGVGFTVVVVPEASMVDQAFQRFWSKLSTFHDLFAVSHAMHRALVAELHGHVDVMDLAAWPPLLQGAYWQMDGHFNELGNERVSEWIAASLSHRMSDAVGSQVLNTGGAR